MMRVRISEDAVQDLNEGFLFYEAQELGLGDYFTACLRADIEGLRVSAGIHRVHYQDYHRLLSKVFPYGIFYTVDREVAVVWAASDLSGCPEDRESLARAAFNRSRLSATAWRAKSVSRLNSAAP